MDILQRNDLLFPGSLPEFQRLFPDDKACAAYLEKVRWRDGFVCSHCQTAEEPFRFTNRPGVLRCRKCRCDTSLVAGTVMERPHTPLSVWFWAAYLVASQTPGVSATQFQRQVGLTRVRLAVAPDRSAESLCGFVEGAVAAGAPIITDDWSGYASLAKRGYKHIAFPERGDPQVAEERLPIVHLVFANLKTWLSGIHHGVSRQHLQAYLNEFTFRFNRRFYPFNAFRSLLGIAGDAAAPTYAELYSGDWAHPTCSGCGC